MATRIPTQAEYERDNVQRFQNRLREVEGQSASDRAEGRKDWFEAMTQYPEQIGTRMGWLINGEYGFGEREKARQIVGNTRSNRHAALSQLFAALEYNTPHREAAAAWNAMTPDQQKKYFAMVSRVLAQAEKWLAANRD